MIYRNRKDLNIIKLGKHEEDIYFDKLEKAILNRPSNIIYCERNKKLHGIITMGDIARASEAGRDFVIVNKRFTSLHDSEHIKAWHIFRDRSNINAIPILDKDGMLTGGCSRWNDLLETEEMFRWGGQNENIAMATGWHSYFPITRLKVCATWRVCIVKSWIHMGLILRKFIMMRFRAILTG